MAKPLVMVALRDAGSLESLMTLACHMATALEADLTVLHVVEVPAATPIEAHDEILDHDGKALLAGAREWAARQFTGKLSTDLLRARTAGDAIVAEAKDRGAELLIIGQGSLGKLGEFLLGSTARHIGRHAPCRVLVEIHPHHRS
jgi:basic amino acid/polyamine antiporter, APA family